MKIWFLFPIWVAVLAYIFYKMQDDPVISESAEVVAERAESPESASVVSLSDEVSAAPEIPEQGAPLKELDAEGFADHVSVLEEELRLFPVKEETVPVSFLWPVDVDGPAMPELMEIASRDSFPKWRPHEDEWISFYYPDDPSITLKVVEGAAEFPMIGETMWTVRLNPFRTYVLSALETGTFCVITLEKKTSFDDTERYPREEVYHRFFNNRGALGRASFMEDGQIRRVQYVGSDIRVNVLDWPHLAIHQNVYRRMALGIRLNRPPVNRERLRDAVLAYYGFPGGLGLIQKGMTLDQLGPLLGDPTGVSDELAVYHKATGEFDRYYRLNLKDGRFDGFGEHWCEANANPPIEGSVDWILEKTQISGGSTGGSKGYSLGAVTDEDAAYIFDRFCELAPKAGPADWKRLCKAVANMAEMKLQDERIPAVIRSRFLEVELPMSHAIQILHSYDSEGSRDNFSDRIRRIIQLSRWGKKEDKALARQLNADFQILIAYLGREDERTSGYILKAMEHRVPEVRSIAYSYWSWIEDESVYEKRLIRGLSDPSAQVRRRCAEAFCENCGTLAEHGAVLEKHLLKERDAETRNYIALALERLRKSATLKVEAGG